MNRMMTYAAAVLTASLGASLGAAVQAEAEAPPAYGREILDDPALYSTRLKWAIKEGKFKDFCLAVSRGDPVRLDKAMPRPWDASILNDPSSVSFRLQKLLKEGRLAEFYLRAEEAMNAFRRKLDGNPPFSEKEYHDRLWMYYFIAAAPPVTIDDDSRHPGPPYTETDYKVKFFTLYHTGFKGSSDEDYLRYEREHRKQLLHLYASYSAGVLKAVRDNYDPEIEEKIKKMTFQPRKEDDEETRHRLFQFFNTKKIKIRNRNGYLPGKIKWMEKLVVKSLLYYFPGKPREVERYLRMAGYRGEEEMDELIYRTVGRIPESECLFKGDRGKRYERKIRTGAVSYVNDRYTDPIELYARDRKWEKNKDQDKGNKTP